MQKLFSAFTKTKGHPTFMVFRVLMAASCVLAFSSTSWADNIIYANNYGDGTDNIWRIDLTTGNTITNQYGVPVSTLGGDNGRGVVDVNNILYVTTSGSGKVFSYNTSTSALSTAFTVAGSSGLSSISYNGSDFWIGDYSGTDKAYLYSPTGTLLDTIHLANCSSNCDGLTYVPLNGGELISNRADGYNQDSIYDIYSSTTGALLTAGFIDTTSLATKGCDHTTGIAWDGTNYFVSCLDDPTASLAEYNSSGSFVSLIALSNPSGFDNSGTGPGMEGLSANFAVTIPPTTTPEPASMLLIGAGLAGIALMRRRNAA